MGKGRVLFSGVESALNSTTLYLTTYPTGSKMRCSPASLTKARPHSGCNRKTVWRSKMRTFRNAIPSLAALMIASMLTATPGFAVCSNATLNGNYGYYHGRTGGSSIDRVVVGQFNADGNGHLSGSWTSSLNGAISSGAFTGTYSVTKDCTGSLTLSDEDLSPADFNLVFDKGAQQFEMIQTDAGTAQPGFGVAEGSSTCSMSGTKKVMATNLVGLLFPAPAQVESIVGQLTLDGNGGITGNETFSVGGTISSLTVTGTYSVSSDCTGTVQITPAGLGVSNFNIVFVGSGREILLIETDPSTLIAGTAQQ